MNALQGQVAVVTGASRGIGKGIAQALAEAGCRLALCARSREPLEKLVAEFQDKPIEAMAAPVDVSQEAQVDAFFEQVMQSFGHVDILVNNAGAFDGGRFDQLTTAAWENVIGACLTGTFLCSRAAFRIMKEQGGGRILNIGSISAQRPREGSAPYAAAKFGVWGLTQAIALDGRAFGITCSCLHPGNVRVERRAGTGKPEDEEPMMSIETIARAALAMLACPSDVNFLEAIVLPRDQLYLGRG